jgi:hypothetical protein
VTSSSKAEGLHDRLVHAVGKTATLIDEFAEPDMVWAFYSNIPSGLDLFSFFLTPCRSRRIRRKKKAEQSPIQRNIQVSHAL